MAPVASLCRYGLTSHIAGLYRGTDRADDELTPAPEQNKQGRFAVVDQDYPEYQALAGTNGHAG
jgi:hypothetical protein